MLRSPSVHPRNKQAENYRSDENPNNEHDQGEAGWRRRSVSATRRNPPTNDDRRQVEGPDRDGEAERDPEPAWDLSEQE